MTHVVAIEGSDAGMPGTVHVPRVTPPNAESGP